MDKTTRYLLTKIQGVRGTERNLGLDNCNNKPYFKILWNEVIKKSQKR